MSRSCDYDRDYGHDHDYDYAIPIPSADVRDPVPVRYPAHVSLPPSVDLSSAQAAPRGAPGMSHSPTSAHSPLGLRSTSGRRSPGRTLTSQATSAGTARCSRVRAQAWVQRPTHALGATPSTQAVSDTQARARRRRPCCPCSCSSSPDCGRARRSLGGGRTASTSWARGRVSRSAHSWPYSCSWFLSASSSSDRASSTLTSLVCVISTLASPGTEPGTARRRGQANSSRMQTRTETLEWREQSASRAPSPRVGHFLLERLYLLKTSMIVRKTLGSFCLKEIAARLTLPAPTPRPRHVHDARRYEVISVRMARGRIDDRRRVRARRGVMSWRALALRLRGIRSLSAGILLLTTMIRRTVQAPPPGHDAPRSRPLRLRLPLGSVLVLLRVRVRVRMCAGM